MTNTKRLTTKIASLFLALVMLLSTFGGLNITAHAASGYLLFQTTEKIRFGESYYYTLYDAQGLYEYDRYKTYRIEVSSPDGKFDFSISPISQGKGNIVNKSKLTYPLGTSDVNWIDISTNSDKYIKVTIKIYDTTFNPATNKITKLTANKTKMKVKWSKKSKVTGYQVQYSTNEKFKNKKSIRIKGSKNTNTTIKKLKKGKKYYVRVRTYRTVNGRRYYSNWSKVKTVKTK